MDKLTSITVGANTTTYLYDGDGTRVKKTAKGVSTFYVGNYDEVTNSVATKYYYPSILRDMLGSAAALPAAQQLSKCNRLALFRAARFVILTVRQRHPLSFPRFVVSAIFFTLAMNLCNFLLISHQDSLARVIVPSVLPRADQLSVTENPFDALSLLREKNLDVVLVEFDEADQDAVIMCKTLRRQSNVPIVMLVNRETRSQVTRGYWLGADAHIELPCDPRLFRARVASLLRRAPKKQNPS